MEFAFDQRGNLQPYDKISLSLDEFQEFFVEKLANHRRRQIYWYRWFSQTKKNRAKKKYPKGFIEIKFD